jgi:uncharacterized membrane protein
LDASSIYSQKIHNVRIPFSMIFFITTIIIQRV